MAPERRAIKAGLSGSKDTRTWSMWVSLAPTASAMRIPSPVELSGLSVPQVPQ